MSVALSPFRLAILFGLAGLNLYTFLLFYIDKRRAVNHKRNRISERKLLVSSLLLGGAGALLGMFILRHKTKHLQFKLLIPISAVLPLAAVFYLFYT